MKKISLTAIIKFVIFSSLIILTVSANGYGRIKKQTTISDELLYTHVFFQAAGFDKEAEKLTDEQDKLFFKDYFKRNANLSDEQNQLLKAIAQNFTSVFQFTSGKEKLKLALRYRDELKRSFGAEAFYRFDSFVREKIAPNMTITKSRDSLTFGSSGILLDEPTHRLIGSAFTVVYNFSLANSLSCSVSATMSGPGVSVSDSNSECSVSNPSVTLISSNYQPNSQYCINATHTVDEMSKSSSDCLMTPNNPRVTSVTYERINNDDLPIDENPYPSPGGGLRIFPDKNAPNESSTIDRRKIRVRAKYFQTTAGVTIYFRNFDLDDPSANSAPIDVETTANAGDDNNGDVDGLPNTKAGKLSQTSAITDANGEATVEFTLTKQPGDNFTVAASTDSDYLTNLTLAADGLNLKDGNNLNTPVTRGSLPMSNACATTALIACRAEMLTVWRRLHIEVDSMGTVSNSNHTTVTVNGAVSIPKFNSPANGIGTVNITNTLLPDVYKYGRLLIGNRSVIVDSNTANSL